jgi:integrase
MKPWYRASKKRWFATIAGKQVNLGADKQQAFRRFEELLAGEGITVRDLCSLYMRHCNHSMKPNTVRTKGKTLDILCGGLGSRVASSLKPRDIESLMKDSWKQGTIASHKGRILSLFNWAVSEELIKENPIRKLRKPPFQSRGSQAVIPKEHYEALLRAANPLFRDVLITLWETGCRPGELRTVTAQDFNAAMGVWLLSDHKTAHKGKPRFVYLSVKVVAICQRLSRENPTGPLFRNRDGKPLNELHIYRNLMELTQRLGLPMIQPYSFRHTFATNALLRGVPDTHVAALLGHSSTIMLHKHYSHLTANSRALRDVLGGLFA